MNAAAPPGPAPQRPARPVTPDDRRWSAEVVELQHTGLKAVREVAASWEKTISAVLGAFGVAAFLTGPEALKDVPGAAKTQLQFLMYNDVDAPRTVALLIFIGALLLAGAVLLAALAAQGNPEWNDFVDGPTLRRLTRDAIVRANERLWQSRVLTVVAALVIVGATAIAWYAQIDAAERAVAPTQQAVVVTGGQLVCGGVETGDDGSVALTVGTQKVALTDPAAFTLVDDCP